MNEIMKIIRETKMPTNPRNKSEIKFFYSNTDANGKAIHLEINEETAIKEIEENNLEYKGSIVKDFENQVFVTTYY